MTSPGGGFGALQNSYQTQSCSPVILFVAHQTTGKDAVCTVSQSKLVRSICKSGVQRSPRGSKSPASPGQPRRAAESCPSKANARHLGRPEGHYSRHQNLLPSLNEPGRRRFTASRTRRELRDIAVGPFLKLLRSAIQISASCYHLHEALSWRSINARIPRFVLDSDSAVSQPCRRVLVISIPLPKQGSRKVQCQLTTR